MADYANFNLLKQENKNQKRNKKEEMQKERAKKKRLNRLVYLFQTLCTILLSAMISRTDFYDENINLSIIILTLIVLITNVLLYKPE